MTVSHGLDRTLRSSNSRLRSSAPKCRSFSTALWSLRLRRRPARGRARRHEGGDAGARVRQVRDFALFGETTGETDEFGLAGPLQLGGRVRGRASVVYGHTPVPEPEWLNRTINIDTGCVFGGQLTALRWLRRSWSPCQPGRRTPTRFARSCPSPAPSSARSRRTTTSSTSRTFGQAARDDTAAPQRDGSRGERGGCFGGDEPVRGKSRSG